MVGTFYNLHHCAVNSNEVSRRNLRWSRGGGTEPLTQAVWSSIILMVRLGCQWEIISTGPWLSARCEETHLIRRVSDEFFICKMNDASLLTASFFFLQLASIVKLFLHDLFENQCHKMWITVLWPKRSLLELSFLKSLLRGTFQQQ